MKTLTRISLTDLTPLDRLKRIPVSEAAAFNNLSEDTFKRHYAHLIEKISPRRLAVKLGDAIDLPPPPRPP